ncbi:MAG: hypothetical protein ACI9Y8_000578 [Candidatus Omnitrophota bacterium]|jgi:hypothetical protein
MLSNVCHINQNKSRAGYNSLISDKNARYFLKGYEMGEFAPAFTKM